MSNPKKQGNHLGVLAARKLSRSMLLENKLKIAFCVGLFAMILGGVVLTLLGFGILHLYRPDFLNLFIDPRMEIWITRIVGLALIISPLCILPYVIKTIESKQSIKYSTTLHVKKRAEEILGAVAQLKSQSATTISSEQEKLLEDVENACLKLVVSISAVISSDGLKSGSPELDAKTRYELR